MTGMHAFGDPARFEVCARWLPDDQPRELHPKEHGWSMGELRIVVGGVVLTQHHLHGKTSQALHWYLGPVLAWLLQQWKWLLHEEAYGWPTRSSESAVFTVTADLERYLTSEFPKDRATCRMVRSWWQRHALRAADASALFPDVFIRRVEDSIEISWLDRQPEFSPEGFELKVPPGTVLLRVEDVAVPLWNFLQWALGSAAPTTDTDQLQLQALRRQMQELEENTTAELEATHIASQALRDIMHRVQAGSWTPTSRRLPDIPAVPEFDPPVLMFGGLNVDMGEHDVRRLYALLAKHHHGAESPQLHALAASPSLYEYMQPYTHGYELAYQTRQTLGIDLQTAFIDIDAILDNLGISVSDEALQTRSIRGVAIAGKDFSPAIVVNRSHPFNNNSLGRRFTLAHELCHVLYDRSWAKRLSHISGPWASARVEKRANAFAAMLLATPHALEKAGGDNLAEKIKQLSRKFGMGTNALTEHMHNLDLLSEQEFLQQKHKPH